MVNRVFALVVCVLTAAGAALAQNQGKSFLFQFPGPEEPGARFLAYTADATPLIAHVDALGPANSRQILAKPDGSKFYILGDGPIQRIDAAFSSFQSLNGIVGAVRVARLTPNGNLLLVGADQFYVVNTANDTIVATGAGVSGTVIDIAVSRDSKRAWVLVESGFNGSIITVDLARFERIGEPLGLTFRGRSLALSPRGLLYVTFSNQIRVFNPDTMNQIPNGLVEVLAVPGPLRFTPDGSTAYFINTEPQVGGRAIFRLNLDNHTVNEWPTFGVQTPPFEDILIAGNQRIFVYSRTVKTLFDVTTSPLGAQDTSLSAHLPAGRVLGVAVSSELPSARFLFALIDNGNQTNLLRIDLANNTISAQVLALINSGRFQFLGVPPQQGAASFLQYNNNQTLQHGGTTLPLITRVLDGLGRPVFNQTVVHSVEAGSPVVIANPEVVTNADGFVQTTVTVPDSPGIYTINVRAGSATTTYTVVVPESGGGAPGGPQLISILSGDGQLVQEFNATSIYHPLKVKIVNNQGQPLAGVPVTFQVVEGNGNLTYPNTTTDELGVAFTDLFAGAIPFGVSFSGMTVRATASVGSVDFKVTVYRLNNDLTGAPEIHIVEPISQQLTIGQGDVLEGAIKASIHSARFPQIGVPIPNVGIRIADRFDPILPGPASCRGLSRSDNNGIASCDVVAGCVLGRIPARIEVGEFRNFDFIFNIVPGSARTLAILAGDNQSGRAGDLLAPIAVIVTDGCGAPVANAQLTWTVIQGSATLSQVQTVTDAGGRASARLTLGNVPGPVQVRVALANNATATPVIFNFNNQAVVSGVFLQSGGGQTALTNQPFQSPVVFIVRDANNNPLPGINLTFSVTGNATINPTQATTNASGTAQTNVTAGNAPGTITVTATFGTFTAVATLQVRLPGPQLTSNSFFNAASFAIGMVPCGLVTAVGPGLKPTPGISSGISPFGPLPYTLDGVSITANGVPAPIQSVANVNGQQQVTFQAPCELQPGAATVQVTVSGATTTVTGVPVLAGQPGIFTYLGPNNRVYGAVIRAADGSYVTPSNPARRGETYFLVLTGLGQVSPATTTNAAGIGNQTVNLPVIVGVNNAGVPVTTAQYLVGSIGVYIVGFQIPANAPTGTDQPLAVAVVIGGQTVFGNSVFLPGVI